jgi:hypothetical protein
MITFIHDKNLCRLYKSTRNVSKWKCVMKEENRYVRDKGKIGGGFAIKPNI